jgi:hypothetical protein
MIKGTPFFSAPGFPKATAASWGAVAIFSSPRLSEPLPARVLVIKYFYSKAIKY